MSESKDLSKLTKEQAEKVVKEAAEKLKSPETQEKIKKAFEDTDRNNGQFKLTGKSRCTCCPIHGRR